MPYFFSKDTAQMYNNVTKQKRNIYQKPRESNNYIGTLNLLYSLTISFSVFTKHVVYLLSICTGS